MKPTFVLLFGAVVLLGAPGAVAADVGQDGVAASAGQDGVTADVGQSGVVADVEQDGVAADVGQKGAPPWPGDETTTANNSSDVSPGQQLAGAVGAQGASVQGELWNRTLSERLANATTDDERAEVVTDEVELLEASIEALEEQRANLTEAWKDDEMSEGEYRASLSEFVVRAHTVELRANQTARAAEDLPESVREDHGINVTYIRHLSEEARELYQFEGEIAQEVANETLENQSAENRPPGVGESSD